MSQFQPIDAVSLASQASIGSLFHSISAAFPQRIALREDHREVSYAKLEERSNRLANYLLCSGLKTGDRIAVLAKNCVEYFELEIAAAKAGVILAAINCRLTQRELQHCIKLAQPKLIFVSDALTGIINNLSLGSIHTVIIGKDYEQAITQNSDVYPDLAVDPESGLIILYTSGTTGLPKGALISHRAMIARGMLYHSILNVPDQDNFIAWAPMYHMVSTDHGLATLTRGGTVWCVDGYQPEKLIWLIENLELNWLVLVPGMVGSFVTELKKQQAKPKSINVIGAMADLIPKEEIAEATTLLNAPFLNTFGATETGLGPATGSLIPIGVIPESLSKTQTPFCDLKLVDSEDREVPVGEPGEASVAGPTLFSGYWANNETNREDFRNNRFHMGDVLRRNPDGTLDYVDRVKYMIKSGGENIYPAEIESVITQDTRIETAVVIRKKNAKWGEVPVVFIVANEKKLNQDEVIALCQTELPGYKIPKEVYFIEDSQLPRSTTGKIQRHLLDALLQE